MERLDKRRGDIKPGNYEPTTHSINMVFGEMLDDHAELLDKYIEELDKLTEVVKAQGERIKEIESQEIMKEQFKHE